MPLSTKDSLLVALRKGNADKVRRILTSGDGDAELHPDMAADSAMNCLLHRAARYGHRNVVKVRQSQLKCLQRVYALSRMFVRTNSTYIIIMRLFSDPH